MIQVTVTHVQGIELAVNRILAIDPEKIVDVRRRGIFTEIDYAESYDRKWKPITYQITAALPNIQAAIQGDWTGKEYLSATVIYGEPREMRPNIWEDTYAIDIQQKFIIDIEEVYFRFPWSTTDELVTKLRFTSSAFLQKVVYVTEHLHDLVPDVPSATTTTTTQEPVTTTTELPVTTTTELPVTTTTDDGLCNYYTMIVDDVIPTIFIVRPCETQCSPEYVMVESREPLTMCLCEPPTYFEGSENYIITIGDHCPEVTTTTTCVPEGEFVNTLEFASSYTPIIGLPISFIDSAHIACEAIDVVNAQMGAFDYFEVDSYTDGKDNTYYLHATCTLLPTGYYVFDIEGYLACHVTDGKIDQYDVCATTTTPEPEVTTTTPEPEVTTTTTP
jgi:hypothetical protein